MATNNCLSDNILRQWLVVVYKGQKSYVRIASHYFFHTTPEEYSTEFRDNLLKSVGLDPRRKYRVFRATELATKRPDTVQAVGKEVRSQRRDFADNYTTMLPIDQQAPLPGRQPKLYSWVKVDRPTNVDFDEYDIVLIENS